MKKTILLLSVLLVMLICYPVLVISGWAKGFSVTVKYPVLTFVILTLLFAALSLYLLLTKEKTVNMATSVLSGLLVPMSTVWLLTSVWENRSFLILLLAVVWIGFSYALMFVYGKESFLKGVVTGLTSLALAILLLVLGFISLFSFGRITVIQTLYSPQGTYYAELIDDDQGALGGNTLVEVYDTRKKVDLGFLTVQKKPQQVFIGRWGLFETMKLEWESEQILRINGKRYEVE